MKKLRILFVIIVALGAGIYVVRSFQSLTSTSTSSSSQSESSPNRFNNPKKAAHYESNTPAHGDTLAGVPILIVIDFNFDLVSASTISITSDDKEYGVGETIIDENKLTMRRAMSPDAPDGLYAVTYQACWPDTSCHNGNFQFVIDRTRAETYDDLRGKSEVAVDMSTFLFKPRNIRVSPGTKITWTNSDPVDHFINTDSHPAHTYFKEQNSRAVSKGGTYSVTYTTPGIYPYHCSAHFHVMQGSILVG